MAPSRNAPPGALAIGLGLLACSPAPPPAVAQPVPQATPKPPPSTLANVAPSATAPASAPPTVPPPSPPPKSAWPKIAFPPPDVEPPSARSAKEGDGVWTRLGSATERIGRGEPTMYRTVIHPHDVNRFISVDVVAIDLAKVEPHFVPGTDDPHLDRLPKDIAPGLIPEAHHDELLVVTNGGFAPRHGRWGMGLSGVTLIDPRDDACTVVLTDEGRVRIAPWGKVAQPDDLRAWRQTPPCLLQEGELHPDLDKKRLRIWAGRDPNRKTRRRSALGLDATGRILFYGMGIETEADDLARGMAAVGATEAVELDINYSWTKFLMFGRPAPDEPLQVTATLIEDMKHSHRGYVDKPAFRDFFYLIRR